MKLKHILLTEKVESRRRLSSTCTIRNSKDAAVCASQLAKDIREIGIICPEKVIVNKLKPSDVHKLLE